MKKPVRTTLGIRGTAVVQISSQILGTNYLKLVGDNLHSGERGILISDTAVRLDKHQHVETDNFGGCGRKRSGTQPVRGGRWKLH